MNILGKWTRGMWHSKWLLLCLACATACAQVQVVGGGKTGDGNQVHTGGGDPNQPGSAVGSPNDVGNPNGDGDPNMVVTNPNDPNGAASDANTPAPLITGFTQGLWRGEDPRVSQANGWYYTIYSVGGDRRLFKSKSLIDRGVGKVIPTNFPHYTPQWIGELNGVTYNAWYAFGDDVWRCACVDPYDNIDQWTLVKPIPWTAVTFDIEVFQNPQPGPYAGRWYMVWAGASYGTVGWGPESVYAGELLDLRPGTPLLGDANNIVQSRIIAEHNWTDVVVEAAGAFIQGTQVNLVYSGNGAQTDNYALGIAVLRPGANPVAPGSWIDHNNGGCDDHIIVPEFAQTANVYGPGVARLAYSADGNEPWLLYHSKVWDTYDPNSSVPAPQQSHNQQWTRQIMLQPMSWRQVVCDGNTYTIPSFGPPIAPGTPQTAPSGDRGLAALSGPMHTEAESWLPYGAVMGPSIQGLQDPNNLDVITPMCASCSAARRISALAALAADTRSVPQSSGLRWHNAPAAHGLRIAAASAQPTRLDLYVDGQRVSPIDFPPTADANTFATRKLVGLDIPRGATVDLRYEPSMGGAPDLDYIEFLP